MKRTKDIALEELQKDNDKLEELNKQYSEMIDEVSEMFFKLRH